MRRLVQDMQGKPALFDSGLFFFSGGKEGRKGGKVQGARCEVRRASALPRGAASAVIGPWTAVQLDMQISACRCGFVLGGMQIWR